MKKISIVVADDHAVVRMGLTALLKTQKDMSLVGEARDGAEAADRCAALRPDVAILDLMMPGTDGVEGTRRIRSVSPGTQIVILTSFGTSDEVTRALAAGAIAAIMKDADNAELLSAIRRASEGVGTLSAEIETTLQERKTVPELTERQREILHWVTRGLTNPEIAHHLGISPDAVKQHLNAVFQKLGAASRAEAVAIALREHLLKI